MRDYIKKESGFQDNTYPHIRNSNLAPANQELLIFNFLHINNMSVSNQNTFFRKLIIRQMD